MYKMKKTIIISSSDRILNTSSHDFTVNLEEEIRLDKNRTHVIGLDSLSMSYSWYNISNAFNNNTIKYSTDSGANWHTITFSNGNYDYKGISGFIQKKLLENNLNSEGIAISFSLEHFRCYIKLATNYRIDLTDGSFSELIGFTKKIVTSSEYGTLIPDITRSVDTLFINSDIVSESHISNPKSSSAIYRFGTANLFLSYPFSKEPRRITYFKLNTNYINRMRVYITDQLGRAVDLNGLNVTLTLIIKTI